jgi:hypothetical protein
VPVARMAGSYGSVPVARMAGSYGSVPVGRMAGSYGDAAARSSANRRMSSGNW